MKDDEFVRIQKLRTIVGYSARGRGVAGAVLSTFASSEEREERDAARRLLLGIPLEKALSKVLSSGGGAWALLKYLATESRVSSIEASKRAEKLSSHFERWAQLKRERLMEGHVIEMRAHILSTVLGAVVSLFSSLAPLISSIQLGPTTGLGSSGSPGSLPFLGIGFSLVSSVFLGLYLSPKRAYLDPLLSTISYIIVLAATAPLNSFRSMFPVGG
ncbi:MAG: hypothetical protein HYY68_04910 [Thaumarchaeota archaeon]|nr:hypothetical protein [Nitrososphaerota archaeon]